MATRSGDRKKDRLGACVLNPPVLYLGAMEAVLRYRGRDIKSGEVSFVRELIASRPAASRRALSIELCEVWDWRQPNGALRDAVCRGLLLKLHRSGHIELPPARRRSDGLGWCPSRREPAPVELDTTPVECSLAQLGPIEIRQVRRTAEEALVNALVHHHHYLRYSQPVGEHLKHLVTLGDRPIGCFCWSSAPRHLAPRDQHIGWSAVARKANIRWVAYQTRFLILPWVRTYYASFFRRLRFCSNKSDWAANFVEEASTFQHRLLPTVVWTARNLPVLTKYTTCDVLSPNRFAASVMRTQPLGAAPPQRRLRSSSLRTTRHGAPTVACLAGRTPSRIHSYTVHGVTPSSRAAC